MITYCIIDDEPIAHRIIEGYCAELPYLKKIGNAYNPMEASVIVTREKIDLIFLDLNMPKMTGFEWLKTLPKPPKIIVTTAHKEYALEGYELDILDYLLKPFSFPRFLKAVNKVHAYEQASSVKSAGNLSLENSRFFLKGDKTYHQIRTDDILFIEAYGNYTKVFLTEEMIVSHEKISAFEDLLPKENFLRIHKSFMVATNKIERIQGNQIFLNEHKIPIGQTYKSRINHLLGGN
ncbi:LytTR family DNA-binding domain-containing protein [Ulvibacterium sp.]|uniref:LytR/AlgR family response regulator transcription factor n=1 Tax=Ulvibacterium sp. TaxID=2665914 RepID=UPI00260798AB|nr:LytTR family DNA-binding domain-containing protein [Ulvibacterium sp.]